MKPSTARMLRANLLVASLAASCIQGTVLLSIVFLRVPERIFLTSTFRLIALSVVVLAVIVTRRLALAAFRSALANGNVAVWGGDRGFVSLSSRCAHPLLVKLHLRFSGRRFSLQPDDRMELGPSFAAAPRMPEASPALVRGPTGRRLH